MAPRGPDSKRTRQELLSAPNASIVCRTKHRVRNLPVAARYKHMGGLVDAVADPKPEVTAR
eukprot:14575266-Alexandrium_andersonii.AAC.1